MKSSYKQTTNHYNILNKEKMRKTCSCWLVQVVVMEKIYQKYSHFLPFSLLFFFFCWNKASPNSLYGPAKKLDLHACLFLCSAYKETMSDERTGKIISLFQVIINIMGILMVHSSLELHYSFDSWYAFFLVPFHIFKISTFILKKGKRNNEKKSLLLMKTK